MNNLKKNEQLQIQLGLAAAECQMSIKRPLTKSKSMKMKHLTLGALAAAALALSARDAAALTFDLNYEFSGGAAPGGSPPWVRITITDTAANTVQIKIDNLGLISTENADGIYLNVADSLVGQLTFSAPTKVGSFDSPIISQSLNGFKADGDGKFDIRLAFTSGGVANNVFGSSETATFTVSATGLDASDFDLTSLTAGGNGIWHAAAHIQNTPSGGSGSGWIGDGEVPPPGFVPDRGTSLVLFGLGIFSLALLAKRIRLARA